MDPHPAATEPLPEKIFRQSYLPLHYDQIPTAIFVKVTDSSSVELEDFEDFPTIMSTYLEVCFIK